MPLCDLLIKNIETGLIDIFLVWKIKIGHGGKNRQWSSRIEKVQLNKQNFNQITFALPGRSVQEADDAGCNSLAEEGRLPLRRCESPRENRRLAKVLNAGAS
jgi:hypothetical protein